jgi:hypothetical protein
MGCYVDVKFSTYIYSIGNIKKLFAFKGSSIGDCKNVYKKIISLFFPAKPCNPTFI